MADLNALLAATSRTFALAVPRLPEPTRREVTVAYLLFRVADTLEDASHWPVEERREGLEGFGAILSARDPLGAAALARSWSLRAVTVHPGYAELVQALPAVLEELDRLSPLASEVVARSVGRSAEGMASFLELVAGPGLRDVAELRRYCYAVAGIVGEMLTELFVQGASPLGEAAASLRSKAAVFGEALQLVNILKDADADAREGRRFVPVSVTREELLALARADLGVAAGYIRALRAAHAPAGYLGFTALPVLLAGETLDAVEAEGPGAKVGRSAVRRLEANLDEALERGALPERLEQEEGEA